MRLYFLESSSAFVTHFVAYIALIGALLILLGIILAAYAQSERDRETKMKRNHPD